LTKKLDNLLIIGIFISAVGIISAIYTISAVIVNFFLINVGIFLRVKDLFFDLVLILLGLLLIRKKKTKVQIPIKH